MLVPMSMFQLKNYYLVVRISEDHSITDIKLVPIKQESIYETSIATAYTNIYLFLTLTPLDHPKHKILEIQWLYIKPGEVKIKLQLPVGWKFRVQVKLIEEYHDTFTEADYKVVVVKTQ